jgi:hypothetical protein
MNVPPYFCVNAAQYFCVNAAQYFCMNVPQYFRVNVPPYFCVNAAQNSENNCVDTLKVFIVLIYLSQELVS